jgi:ubiquinone/menaquinone biosynthesis C-methylase UbiE
MPNRSGYYVDTEYLAEAARLLERDKHASYEMMRIAPHQTVLDVGCGPGTDTVPMAQIVGPKGLVVGVDYDSDMLREANQRATQTGVNAWVRHQRADVHSLPFHSSVFDACRCERVLQHVADPEQVLVEMVRVAKPGGWVVAGEPDWASFAIDVSDPALIDVERRLIRYKADHLTRHGYVGRQLYRLFRQRGLEGLEIRTITVPLTNLPLARRFLVLDDTENQAIAKGVLTSDELQRWRTSLERSHAEGAFFANCVGIIVAGRKPTAK